MSVFLTPDKILTAAVPTGGTLSIKQKFIADGSKLKPNLLFEGGKPKGITIHNTDLISVVAGTNPAEQYSRSTINGNMGDVVVHYYVYKNEIWQLLRLNEQGWHSADGQKRVVGNKGIMLGGNRDTVAIEVIESNRDYETEFTAAKLTAYLLKEYGLGTGDIYSHFFFYPPRADGYKKYCPVYILPHWNEFKQTVQNCLAASVTVDTATHTDMTADVFYRVTKQIGAWNSKTAAEKQAKDECGTVQKVKK